MKEKNKNLLTAVSIVILALILRLIHLGTKSIYVDEAVTVYICSRPLSAILPFMMKIREVHPPLYFWLVRLWFYLWPAARSFIPSNEAFMRLSSVLFGVGNVLMTYLLGKNLFNRKTAIGASFLLSLSTFHIYYSQELRMYPALLFFMLMSFHFFILFLEKPTIPRGIGLAAANGLALLTHYYSFYILLIELIFGLYLIYFMYSLGKNPPPADQPVESGKDITLIDRIFTMVLKDRKTMKANMKWTAIISFLSVCPFIFWIPNFISQTGHQDFSLRVNPAFSSFFLLFSKCAYGQNIAASKIWNMDPLMTASLLPILLIIVAFMKGHGKGKIFAGIYLMVPIVITFIVTFTRFHIFEYKYFFIITPPFWMLLTSGIISLKTRYLKEFIFSLFILVNGFTLFNFHTNSYYQSQNWRGAALYVKSRIGAGERVIVNPSMMSLPFYYYFPEKERVMPMDKPDMGRLKVGMGNGKGLWLVTTVNHPFVKQAGLIDFLLKYLHLRDVYKFRCHNPADVIHIYYFIVPQKEKDNSRRSNN